MATPIEQQMSGVDNMLYMYSLNQTTGSQMQLRVNFDVATDPEHRPGPHQPALLAGRLPAAARRGEPGRDASPSPSRARCGIFALYSPKGTYDPLFLANYAYVNINDPMTRVPGVGQVQIFGAGQYAMRLWVNPDTLAKLDITVNEIVERAAAPRTPSTRPARSAATRCRPARSSPTRCARRDAWRARRSSRTSWCGPSPTARWSG